MNPEYVKDAELDLLTPYQRDRWRSLLAGFTQIRIARENEQSAFGKIPERMHGALIRWVIYRIPPGHFLSAILKNDLREAVSRADDENVGILHQWVRFLHNHTPSECWGSKEVFDRWVEGADRTYQARKPGRAQFQDPDLDALMDIDRHA